MTTAPQPDPAPPIPAPAAGSSSGTPAWVVAILSVLCTVMLMVLCIGAGLVVLLRPGAADPLTAMLGTAGVVIGVISPFVSVALARRQR